MKSRNDAPLGKPSSPRQEEERRKSMTFTASDGTKFEDRNAWRQYEFETNYTFRNKTGETLMKLPGKVGGQPFDLSDLHQCEVLVLDQIDQVQMDNLSNCRAFLGPSSESVFVRNCTDCVFTVACKQLRTRDCKNCTFYLYSLTDPIIETSMQMQFAPFNGAYNGLERHFADARLEPANNHWSQVYDFNDPDKTGANWSILKQEQEMEPWVVNLESHIPNAEMLLGPCVNPVARDSGFVKYTENSQSGSSGMQSFTFQTSQREAMKTLETAPATAVSLCEKEEPALMMPPLPTSSPTVPPPAMMAPSESTSLPPPAPVASMEPQKLAVVKPAEHPSPTMSSPSTEPTDPFAELQKHSTLPTTINTKEANDNPGDTSMNKLTEGMRALSAFDTTAS